MFNYFSWKMFELLAQLFSKRLALMDHTTDLTQSHAIPCLTINNTHDAGHVITRSEQTQ